MHRFRYLDGCRKQYLLLALIDCTGCGINNKSGTETGEFTQVTCL